MPDDFDPPGLSDAKLKQAEHVLTMAHQMSQLHLQAQMFKEAIEMIAAHTGVDLSPVVTKYTAQIDEVQQRMHHSVERLHAEWQIARESLTEAQASLRDDGKVWQASSSPDPNPEN